MRHVADGVNVDQRADAGDDHQHHGGQPVDGEIAADVERAALDPGEVVLDECAVSDATEPSDERLQHPQERQQHAADGDQR